MDAERLRCPFVEVFVEVVGGFGGRGEDEELSTRESIGIKLVGVGFFLDEFFEFLEFGVAFGGHLLRLLMKLLQAVGVFLEVLEPTREVEVLCGAVECAALDALA